MHACANGKKCRRDLYGMSILTETQGNTSTRPTGVETSPRDIFNAQLFSVCAPARFAVIVTPTRKNDLRRYRWGILLVLRAARLPALCNSNTDSEKRYF